MKKIFNFIHLYFFSPTSANYLGFARIAVATAILIFLTSNQFNDYPHSEFYQHWTPSSLFVFIKQPISLDTLIIFNNLLKIFLVFSILGLGTRLTSIIAFLLGLFVHGYLTNFSNEFYHHSQMAVLGLGILCTGPVNDSLSIDSYLKNKKFISNKNSEFYRFPLILLLIWVMLVYFVCGYQKFINSPGLDWIFSQNLRLRLHATPRLTGLGEFFLYSPNYVIYILAALAYFAELLAPLVLIRGKWYLFFAFLWTGLHFFVRYSFGGHLSFFSQIGCYIALIPFMLKDYDKSLAK